MPALPIHPNDPYQFIVNETLHHFSTKPTPYTLHCPASSHASTLSGLSALKIPPHCQFKSSVLLHDHHPAITQAYNIRARTCSSNRTSPKTFFLIWTCNNPTSN